MSSSSSARPEDIPPDLSDAIDAIVGSMSASGPVPESATLDLVRRFSDSLLAGAPGGERTRRAAAVIVAQTREGEPSEALRLADREVRAVDTDASLPAAETSLVLAAAAEAFVTAGDVQSGTPLAARALGQAERASSDALRFRAHSLLAVGHALNGEYADAERSVVVCRGLQEALGWEPGAVFYPLILGEILIASSRLDADRLLSIVTELRATAPDHVLWAATATSAEAMALLATNDASRAIPMLLTILSNTNERGILPMIRGFSLGIYADLLLARGEARRALTLLEGRRSPQGHALCFDMQRSAAHLMLGEDRRALVVTDDCVRLGPRHNLRTVPPLLFRRALALDRLGHRLRADEAFEEGFHLVRLSGSATPLLTLPHRELLALLDRLRDRRPELAVDADDFERRLRAVPMADGERSLLPQLTGRERLMATHLRAGGSLPAIASELRVSQNTVKSQVQTLYRKLGVGTRAEALTILERAGFFD